MERVTLGRTGLELSVAGLGCGGHSRLGQSRGASFEESVRVVQTALDRGITLIDTAARYGTEAIVGAAIEGRRHEVIVSTKLPITEGEGTGSLVRPERFRRALDESLARLRTDHVDILHLHGVAPEHYGHAREVLAPIAEEMRQAGKVRFIGITERFSTDTTHAMLTRAVGDPPWDVLMVGFNFVNQTALRHVLPRAAAIGRGVLCMFAVRGALADRARLADLIHDLIDRSEIDPDTLDPGFPLEFLLAPGVASSLTDAAYRFCRHAPGVDVVLTGTGNVRHLEENVASIEAGALPLHAIERLKIIFGGVRSVAPN